MSASGFEKLFGKPDVFSGTDWQQTDGLWVSALEAGSRHCSVQKAATVAIHATAV